MLIKSLPEVNCNFTESAYAYSYQGIYSTTGHRGIGVTFDADTLEKVEYAVGSDRNYEYLLFFYI